MTKKMFLVTVLLSVTLAYSCDKGAKCAKTQIIQSEAANPTLVTINGQPITENDFNKELSGQDKGAMIKAKNELFETQKNILEGVVFKKLVEAEAAKKKISSEEYLKKEIEGKLKPVKDAEVEGFYRTVKLQYEKNGKVPPPLNDEIKTQIRQKLTMDQAMKRKQEINQQLLKTNEVVYGIEQPRMQVENGTHPSKGAKDGKITIVEFSDFQCPFCQKGADTMKEVMKKFGSNVTYYFRDYPLSFHDRAKNAANAARCASEQGKFWEFHDKVFADNKKLADEDLIAVGKSLKLDMAKFEPCVKQMQKVAEVEKDQTAGENVGVSGTPAYFINGIFLSGALPIEKFEEVINEELKK